jgi:citrate lyase subunit beta/citryl-CoA lyase
MRASSADSLPLWRSLLFVPTNVERFVASAHTRGADAIQLDLEDSVPPSEKEETRRRLLPAIEQVSQGTADVLVRINRPWRLALRDLEAAICPRVRGIAVPKVENAQHLQAIDEVISELESEEGMEPGSTALIAMIETASGFLNAREIACSTPRVMALTLGSEDFASSVGMAVAPEILVYPKQHIIISARAAGVMPLGLVDTIANYKDLERFRSVARRSRQLGVLGASAIHPDQVRILNEEFSPTRQEVDRAERLVEAYERSIEDGQGAFEFEGEMVDIPIVQRARTVISRHQAIKAKESDSISG